MCVAVLRKLDMIRHWWRDHEVSKSPVICAAMLAKRMKQLAHPLNKFIIWVWSQVTQRLGTKEAMGEWQESALQPGASRAHVWGRQLERPPSSPERLPFCVIFMTKIIYIYIYINMWRKETHAAHFSSLFSSSIWQCRSLPSQCFGSSFQQSPAVLIWTTFVVSTFVATRTGEEI